MAGLSFPIFTMDIVVKETVFVYCLCSTGCLHNETCNIWTHVFASLYFFNCYLSHDPSSASKFVALAACYLFTVSSVAHSCSCHSEYVEKVMFRVDRASIALYFLVFVLVAGYQHFVLSRGELMYFQIFGMFAGLGWDNKRFHDVFWRQICKTH